MTRASEAKIRDAVTQVILATGGSLQRLDESVSVVCVAIGGLTPAIGWQPIETAPKDGTRILVAYEGQTRIAAWGKTSHVPLHGFCLADQGVEDFDLVQVELWQPLPAPPEVAP